MEMERIGTLSTTALPPLAAAMTPADLAAHRDHLLALLGAGGDIALMLGYDRGGIAFIYGDRARTSPHTIRGDAWDAVITDATTWITSQASLRRAALIRRMALSVVDLTDQHGECREGRLAAAGFAKSEIAEHHAAACAIAAEMCARTSFTVLMEG